jgi:hypothetical protein
MIPSGYEKWVKEAKSIMITCVGSTYSAETECSRITLTRGLSRLDLGEICIIPFHLEKLGCTEPSFDIIGKVHYSSTEKRDLVNRLAGGITSEGAFIQIDGWMYRFFTNMEYLTNTETLTYTQPGWNHVIIGGLRKNLRIREILYVIRQIIDTTVAKYAYTREMLNSKEIIIYTAQEINNNLVLEYIPNNYYATDCDMYCYTQIRLPGKDRVTAYSGLRDQQRLCTGVITHRPNLNV